MADLFILLIHTLTPLWLRITQKQFVNEHPALELHHHLAREAVVTASAKCLN
jgi:hypothetical protein